MTYPHICFSVDNFDEIFNEVVVRDGESIGIELTASDPKHESIVNTVLFSASVPYETIKRVHEARSELKCLFVGTFPAFFLYFSFNGSCTQVFKKRYVINQISKN